MWAMKMEDLTAREYVRQRLEPRPGDAHYLALSDLSLALRSLIPANLRKVLDYGCGGSPYRPLFGNCVYHRADLDGDGLDFKYGSDSRLPNSAGGYDFVLSTQVLEHVQDPMIYLHECHRVLKPNGQLLITTHGLFEEHGCPYDYWRWTTFGLQRIVESAGFKVEANKKLTTGSRAATFLAERQFINWIRSRPMDFYSKLLARGIRIVRRIGATRLHVASDNTFAGNRVVNNLEENSEMATGHEMYIGIAILARRQ